MAKSDVKLKGKLVSVSSQRVQYKPYGYELEFETVWVEVEVPRSGVVGVDGNNVTLSLDGLNALLQVTADSVDKLEVAYQRVLNDRFNNR